MKTLKAFLLGIGLIGATAFGQTSISIPNTFTPNGDGVNDIFFVTSTGYEEITVSIFNRYGEPVYRYYGINGNWDGFTHAGDKCTPGTYWVFVEASTSDGTSEKRQGIIYVNY